MLLVLGDLALLRLVATGYLGHDLLMGRLPLSAFAGDLACVDEMTLVSKRTLTHQQDGKPTLGFIAQCALGGLLGLEGLVGDLGGGPVGVSDDCRHLTVAPCLESERK